MRSLPWLAAACLLAAIYLIADLYAWHGPLRQRLLAARMNWRGAGVSSIAEVHGRTVTLVELRDAMRAHLWRRGENWSTLSPEAQRQTRWQVAENLVNERLVDAFQTMDELDRKPDQSMVDHEFDMWSRQFESGTDRATRLAWQQLTAADLQTRMRATQGDQAWIDGEMTSRLKDVTEEQARQWFATNRESMRMPTTYRAAHIYLTRHDRTKPDREAEIRELQRRLTAGESTFAALAAESSDDERTKNHGGDLGWFTAERMPADFMAALDRMNPGETTAPVLTSLGWHIIRLNARKPSRLTKFEEVREEVLAMLRSEQREAAMNTLITKLRRWSASQTESVLYRPEFIESALPAD